MLTKEERAKEYGNDVAKYLTEHKQPKQVAETMSDSCELAFLHGAEWQEKNPSDETIELILNCMGYEEKSWIDFVKKKIMERKIIEYVGK